MEISQVLAQAYLNSSLGSHLQLGQITNPPNFNFLILPMRIIMSVNQLNYYIYLSHQLMILTIVNPKVCVPNLVFLLSCLNQEDFFLIQ